MERRNVLTGLGAAVAGAPAVLGSRAASAAAADKRVAISPEYKYPGVEGKLLVNKPRAYAVMEEHGIDGLVALNPINVYYLANTITVGTKFRAEYPAFATFPRDPQQPSFLIAG